MRNSLFILFVLICFSSCKKLNDDKSEKLVGEWKYFNAGHVDISTPPYSFYEQSDKDYSLNFSKNGTLKIIDDGIETKHFITNISFQDSPSFPVTGDKWTASYSFSMHGEKESIEITFIDDDYFVTPSFPNNTSDVNYMGGTEDPPSTYMNIFKKVN